MKKAALYARTSTDRQEKEATIQSQLAEIEEKIKDDGNILLEHCKFVDDGWSGILLARPAFDAMRDTAFRKEFEVLYVYDRGRLSRKFAYQELILEELSEQGINFVTLHDAKAETPEEKILQGMQGLFHEYERIKIAERMRRGKLYKAKSGVIITSSAPYGYRYVPKSPDKHQYYEIEKEEATVVQKIFEWVANEGLTIRRVVKRLYELGIYPRKKKRSVWSRSQISRMLRKEDYIGKAYYNKRKGVIAKNYKQEIKYRKTKKTSMVKRPKEEWIAIPVPAIIDEELFYKAHRQLKVNYRTAKRNRKYDYILTGKIYCECGSPMCGDPVNNQRYYRCSSRIKRYPLTKDCMAGNLNVLRIEGTVWNTIQELLNNRKLVWQQAERWLSNKVPQINNLQLQELEKLRTALRKVKDEELRQAKAYGEGVLEFEQFKKLMNDLKLKKISLERQIKRLESQKEKYEQSPKLSTDEICQRVPFVLKDLLQEEKRQIIIEKTIKNIVVDKERTYAKIQGYIPLNINQDLVKYAKRRNTASTIPHFTNGEQKPRIPFELHIKLPPPRRKPRIVERDKMGRIIHSSFPPPAL